MDDDSALVLFRAARDADPRFLTAQLEYVQHMLGWGERGRLQAEYQRLASGGDPFFACLWLIIQHYGDPDGERAALARLDSTSPPSSCSAARRLELLSDVPRPGEDLPKLETAWRQALRLAPDYPVRVARAVALFGRGRWEEARALLGEAIRRSSHPLYQVHYHVLLAAVERDAGDTVRSDEIRRTLEAAIQRDGRPGVEWFYINNVGSYMAGLTAPGLRDSVAFRRLRLAFRFGRWNHRLSALYQVASHLLDDQGNPSAALPYLNHMVALADTVARPSEQLRAYTLRGRIYSKMGRLPEAERDLLRAIAAGESAPHPWHLGEAYHNLAHVYESLGRLAEASRAADQWIATVNDIPSYPSRMMAYHDAGMIRWKAGWHAAAKRAFDEMVRAVDELGLERYWAGEYLEREGELQRALSYYRLAVNIDRETIGWAGLARVYEALGFPDSAEAAAREHDRLLDNPWAVPLQPRILLRQGRGDEAITVARTWAERRINQGNVQGAALSLLELSELLLELRQSPEAALQAERAADLARQLNLTDELIRARRLVGVAQVQLGDIPDGLKALREAAALARDHPTTDGMRETHLALGDALAAANRVAEALDAYDRATRAVEQVVGHLTVDLDRARYRAHQLAPFDGALRLLLRQPDSEHRSRDLLRWSERRKAAALALAVASGAGGSIRGPASPETLRQRLGNGEALLDYLLVDTRAAVIVVTRAGISVQPLPVSVDSLRRWIDELTWPLRAKAGGQVDLARLAFDAGLARRLYAALLGPLEPLLAGKTRLTIVPDGVLHYLPFEALVPPAGTVNSLGPHESRTYVLDRYEIVYRPSSQFLARASAGDRDRLTRWDRVLVLAHGVPAEQGEVEAIRGAWGASQVSILAGNAASETAATQAPASYGVLHFAVHAVADDQDPLKSHLRLAADSANDGYLHLSEIAASRHAAKLVVLSACETLSGKLYEGEGLMGLARAFLASGGQKVLATRWPVGAPSAKLISVFYGGVANGANPAAALRNAKLALRRDHATAHPFYWAGFTLLSAR